MKKRLHPDSVCGKFALATYMRPACRVDRLMEEPASVGENFVPSKLVRVILPMDSCKLQWHGAVGVCVSCSVVARKRYWQKRHQTVH